MPSRCLQLTTVTPGHDSIETRATISPNRLCRRSGPRARPRPSRSPGYGPPMTWWRWICRLRELGGAVRGPGGPAARCHGFSADDGEDLPGAGHALKLVAAAAFQPDRGARDQVADRTGDQDLPGAGQGGDAGSGVHGDA